MSGKQFYSNDELVTRLWDKEKVRDLMARHSYYMANNWRRQELNDLWVKRYDNRKTASLGNNKGYYVGWEEISNYYVVQNEELGYKRLKEYSDADSEVTMCSSNLGKGQACTHTTNTHLVELSDDGLTAQYLAIDSGMLAIGHPGGKAEEYVTSGTILADLIKEGDEWKIWHLKLQHDATCSMKDSGEKTMLRIAPPPEGEPGEDMEGREPVGGPPPKPKPVYLGPDPVVETFGEPTVPMDAYLPKFGWTYLPEQMPKPYDYFDSRNGFGPDGQKKYITY